MAQTTDAAAAGTPASPHAPARRPIPLARRKGDLLFIAFFLLNLGFITYIVDLEQIVIANPAHFVYPLWPPAPLIDLVHTYGKALDPLVLARPVWWKATIWIDALFFGPFYAVALYAYTRGRDWIRMPTVIWASVLMTNVTIILFEEVAGPSATPQLPLVILLNVPWLLVPIAALVRMWRTEYPFTESVPD